MPLRPEVVPEDDHALDSESAPHHLEIEPHALASRLVVPQGARGIAAVVDGRLWFTSRSGLRIEGLPVDSAALSPHALYVAAGIGDRLRLLGWASEIEGVYSAADVVVLTSDNEGMPVSLIGPSRSALPTFLGLRKRRGRY